MQKNKKRTINIPNILTITRIALIPLLIVTFFVNTPFWGWAGGVVFGLAGITDYMDGYYARHLKQGSTFGKMLDPIADKILVGASLLMLAYSDRLGALNILPAVIILSREILVSGLREFLAQFNVGCPVTRLAKWKTTCQMTAIPVLIVAGPMTGPAYWLFFVVGTIALWGAAILTVMTGYDYWKSGSKHFLKE